MQTVINGRVVHGDEPISEEGKEAIDRAKAFVDRRHDRRKPQPEHTGAQDCPVCANVAKGVS